MSKDTYALVDSAEGTLTFLSRGTSWDFPFMNTSQMHNGFDCLVASYVDGDEHTTLYFGVVEGTFNAPLNIQGIEVPWGIFNEAYGRIEQTNFVQYCTGDIFEFMEANGIVAAPLLFRWTGNFADPSIYGADNKFFETVPKLQPNYTFSGDSGVLVCGIKYGIA